MYKEYDVIKSLRNLGKNVPINSKGTILMIHESVPYQYEVEFVDEEGKTLDVLTVLEIDITVG